MINKYSAEFETRLAKAKRIFKRKVRSGQKMNLLRKWSNKSAEELQNALSKPCDAPRNAD